MLVLRETVPHETVTRDPGRRVRGEAAVASWRVFSVFSLKDARIKTPAFVVQQDPTHPDHQLVCGSRSTQI